MAGLTLPTLAEMRSKPLACPKGQPHVIVKAEKKKSKQAEERAFLRAVWARDKSRSRYSRKPLSRSGTDWDKVGNVHHVQKRSTNPASIYDPARGILLSRTEHALAETRCNNAADLFMLTIDGPADLGKKQTFTLRDSDGKVLTTRQG